MSLPLYLCALPLLTPALWGGAVEDQETWATLAALLPEETPIVVELPGLAELAQEELQHPVAKGFLESPLGRFLEKQAGAPAGLGLWALNRAVGRPALPWLASLTEGGLFLGLAPQEGSEPALCLVAQGDTGAVREVLEPARRKKQQGWRQGLMGPRDEGDWQVWNLGPEACLALPKDPEVGVWLASSSQSGLRAMLERDAITVDPAYVEARSNHRGEQPFLWAWVDGERLEALAPGGQAKLREAPRDPGAQLLLGASLAGLGVASSAVFEANLEAERWSFDWTSLETADPAQKHLAPPVEGAVPTFPAATSSEVARLVAYRDLAAFFRHRAELFDAAVQPELAEATANLSLFFAGQDLAEEILPGIDPWMGLIVRQVELDPVPDLPLPAAALVLRLKEPEVLGPQLVAAVQSILSITNVEAAQQAMPVLSLELELQHGVTMTFGRYRRPAEGEGVDVRYNLEPACAVYGDHFVLGTHRALVGELLGQMVAGDWSEEQATTGSEHLRLVTAPLGQTLREHEETFVLDAMLKEGKSESEARNELRGLQAAAGWIDSMRFETARSAAREVRASLEVLFRSESDR